MYGIPLTISNRAEGHDNGAHGSTGSSPSRPISSPITPSSANLTRQLHGLMPIDQTFAYGGHFASVGQVPSSVGHPHGHSHGHGHGGHQQQQHQLAGLSGGPSPAHSSASIHPSVIHENTVAKILATAGHESGHGHGLHLSSGNEQGGDQDNGHHAS